MDDEADSLLPILAHNLPQFLLSKEPDAAKAISVAQATAPEVILLDLHFPGDERRQDGRTAGGALLAKIRRELPLTPVVVFTTRLDDMDIPLEAFDEQPHGYFAKPAFANDPHWAEGLSQAMRDAIEAARPVSPSNEIDLGFFVGTTKEMRQVAARIRAAGRNTLAVLIYGETGTGKRLAAEAIHKVRGRKGRFENYNCLGIGEDALDSALFGRLPGPFSGNIEAKPGLFTLADGGTVFLDQFQALPVSLQNKLLAVAEYGTIRVGATTDTQLDVQLIVATSHNLSDLVADGVLIEELAYRLSASFIFLPPLRERNVDLPELYQKYITAANSATGKHIIPVLRPETLRRLEQHPWPGNLREFEATILRAVTLTSSNILLPEDIEFLSVRAAPPGENSVSPVSPAAPTHAPVDYSRPVPLAVTLTDYLEGLQRGDRYDFLKGQSRELQKEIVTEFTRRLRARSGKRVTHKVLAYELDRLENAQRDLDKIRQFVWACGVQLTRLECNQ